MPAIEPTRLWFMNCLVTIHQAQADSADNISIVEQLLPPGFGPPVHIHHDEDETFILLDGTYRFQQGDTVRTAGPGDVLHLPKKVPHGFRVTSATPGRLITVTTRGFETMLRAVGQPAAAPTLPDPIVPTPDMLDHLAAQCSANGIDLTGPPID